MDTVLIRDISLLINSIGAGTCFLLSYSFFRTNRQNVKQENSILSFLFFIIGFVIFNTILNFTGYSRSIYGFEPMSNAFCLALAPLLYLYIKHLKKGIHTRWLRSVHLLPFYAYLIITLLVLIFPASGYGYYGFRIIRGGLLVVLWNIQFAIYLLLAFRELSGTDKSRRQNTTLLYWGIASIWLINTLLFIYRTVFSEIPQLLYLNITLLFTLLTLKIAYGQLMGNMFTGNSHRHKKSLKKEDYYALDQNEISMVIRKNKYYRDADLDIRKLASLLKLPYHQLSRYINSKHQKNFNEFINGFRIEEVLQALASEQQNSYTIMGLAQKAGFNSGSAFYAAFKKEVGTTPKLFLQSKMGPHPVFSSDL